MKGLIKSVNSLPLIIKLLLCIPGIDLFYGVLRVINQFSKGHVLLGVLSILLIVPLTVAMWLVDIIWIALTGHACLLG